MLKVMININFANILTTHVVRIAGGTRPNDINTYELPDGRTFEHRYGDGAIKLAIKVLQHTKEPPIIRNRAKCKKCKQIIESKFTHDFVTCKCGAISLDGGQEYCRRIGQPIDFQEVK